MEKIEKNFNSENLGNFFEEKFSNHLKLDRKSIIVWKSGLVENFNTELIVHPFFFGSQSSYWGDHNWEEGNSSNLTYQNVQIFP